MKYTLRYVNRNKFFYPHNIGAYNDFGVGDNPSGSYIVMHMTDRLSKAAMYDTREIAKEVSRIEVAEFDPKGLFELVGVMRISKKKLFEIRLKDK